VPGNTPEVPEERPEAIFVGSTLSAAIAAAAAAISAAAAPPPVLGDPLGDVIEEGSLAGGAGKTVVGAGTGAGTTTARGGAADAAFAATCVRGEAAADAEPLAVPLPTF